MRVPKSLYAQNSMVVENLLTKVGILTIIGASEDSKRGSKPLNQSKGECG